MRVYIGGAAASSVGSWTRGFIVGLGGRGLFLGPGGSFLLRSHLLVEGVGDRFLFSIIGGGGGGYFDLAPGCTDIDLMQGGDLPDDGVIAVVILAVEGFGGGQRDLTLEEVAVDLD